MLQKMIQKMIHKMLQKMLRKIYKFIKQNEIKKNLNLLFKMIRHPP